MIKLSKEVGEVIEFSRVIASNLGHSFIGTEHLLLALLGRKKSDDFLINKFDVGLTYSDVMDAVLEKNLCGERSVLNKNNITKNYEAVISKSYVRAYSRKSEEVNCDDLFLSLLSEKCTASEIINKCKRGQRYLENSINKTFSITFEKLTEMRKNTPVLNEFSLDVTLSALEDKLDPVFERDEEIDKVIQILLRKSKNNPCLVGGAGVGKSAIAEGLALRMIEGKVPYELSQKRLVSLDLALLLAGAKYRGDFEERIKSILDEVKKAKNVILMIDEIHSIVNTGSGEGTLDAANILKPELARGEISIIGATTAEEYMKNIEKDSALDRRFQKVVIEEPSYESSVKILKGLKSRYERFHGIEIDDGALVKAIEISMKLYPNKHLPDKAIDVLDESAAKTRMNKQKILTKEDMEVFYSNSSMKTEGLLENLNKLIVDQEEAIEKINELLLIRRSEFMETASPVSMMFVGSTGCGKTKTAKEISKYLLSGKTPVKLDMGEYSEGHSVSKLIGAPPGYVGYEDNGILIKEVSKNPSAVIIFDEIEKAHADVIKLFLNLLDEGIMTDSRGKRVSFSKCIFIFTSNLSCENNVKSAGFVSPDKKERLNKIKSALGNEFIGRLDGIITFKSASEEGAFDLINKKVDAIRGECCKRKIAIEIDFEVIEKLVELSDVKRLGYRNVEKTFELHLSKEITKILINSKNILTKIRFYLNPKGEITSFSDFCKFNLENNELSMYNSQKRVD